ncbi:tetratricopeptide repeat protein [Trinickia sp. LjRoot230]|uniref:tetratricopeptide repeat protein n=1 Tax=Trinickia sp. LjRoot230 TaxID=3342288 RepID=UPI003ECFCACF
MPNSSIDAQPADAERAALLEAAADGHFMGGEFSEALSCQLQSVALRTRMGDWAGAGNGAHAVGFLRFLLADHVGAVQSYEEALQLRERAGDVRGQGLTLGRMAGVFQQIGNHGKAVELLQRSLACFARTSALKDMGTGLNNMAVSLREMGDVNRAMQCYERSLELRRQVDDFDGLAATLHNISVLYFDQAQYDRAFSLLEEARQIRETMGDCRGLGQTVLRLGMIYEAKGDLAHAKQCYEDALHLARGADTQSRDDEATALLNLADVMAAQGDTDGALAALTEAENLFSKSGMNAGIAMVCCGRGYTFASAGRLSEALACFEEANVRLMSMGDRPRLFATLTAMATILSQCGRHQEARTALASSLELQTQLPQRHQPSATAQATSREAAAWPVGPCHLH